MKKLLPLIFCCFLACDSDDDPVTTTNPPDEPEVCEEELAKGDRMMGIDLLDVAQSGDFNENITLANELGIQFIALHLPWTSIETSPEQYEDPGNALELLAQVAEANGWKFSVTIRPIDLTGKTVPSDLKDTRFNDQLMEDRFKALIDFVLTKVNVNTLHNFIIGNEIDGYNTSGEPASLWPDYGEFLSEMTDYLHTKRSDLLVGFTGTLHGLVDQQTTFKPLFQNVDIVGVNYYPLNNDFTVLSTDEAIANFEEFMGIFTGMPVYMQELGFQTASICNSSESQQAEFFDRFFCSWDVYKDELKSVSIVRLNDLSVASAEASAIPYGLTDPRFIDYLRTLGLRNYDGTLKEGFNELKENLESRGW